MSQTKFPLSIALTLFLILIAWSFGYWQRVQWVKHAENRPSVKWQKHYLPTTHDAYLFASVIQQGSKKEPSSEKLKGHPDQISNGALTVIGVLLAKYAGFHPLDIATYLPVFAGGLLAIPLILIGRLYNVSFLGFGAACLAVSASSYFNRTIAGYLDTDLFAVTIPAFLIFFLLKSNRTESVNWLIAAVITIFIYPFFYEPGSTIVTAVGVMFIAYRFKAIAAFIVMFIAWRSPLPMYHIPISFEAPNRYTLIATTLISVAVWLCPNTAGYYWTFTYWHLWVSLLVIAVAIPGVIYLSRSSLPYAKQALKLLPVICLLGMVIFGTSLRGIWAKTLAYLPGIQKERVLETTSKPNSSERQIKYKNVMETIIEAKNSSWSNLMVRISGSEWACLLAVLGYCLLIVIYPEFIIALPLVGIGIFAHWGGHRFTIHAVPIAALALAFLPYCMLELWRRIYSSWSNKTPKNLDCMETPNEFSKEHGSWFGAILASHVVAALIIFAAIIPNIGLAIDRSKGLATVLDSYEVKILDDIKQKSRPGDYVLTWWDWGSATWFHAQRNVLTSPNNQSIDNYIFAKMMTTDSSRLSAHLGRTAAEYFHHGGPDGTGGVAVKHLFKDQEKTPNQIIDDLEENLPVEPTRDVYIYLPAKLFHIYPILREFSERDLLTGKEKKGFDTTIAPYCQKDGDILQVGPQQGYVSFFADLKQAIVCKYYERLTPQKLQKLYSQGNDVEWISGMVSLQSKNGALLHTSNFKWNRTEFSAQLLDGTNVNGALAKVEWIFPSAPLKKIEELDANKSVTFPTEHKNEGSGGLCLAFSINPPLAVLTEEEAFNSQLFQMLVLGKFDSSYFELISTNPGGKAFKIKR